MLGLALCLSAGFSLPSASAQERPAASDTQTETTPSDKPGDSRFIGELSRFSTILGSLHFLAQLCGDKGDMAWRDEMANFIDRQQPAESDKRYLIASFNNGYRAFDSTYRSCTSAARLAHNRYRDEGIRLAKDIVTRFGN